MRLMNSSMFVRVVTFFSILFLILFSFFLNLGTSLFRTRLLWYPDVHLVNMGR